MTARLATHPDVAHRWPVVRDALSAARVHVEPEPVVVDPLRWALSAEAELMMVGPAALRRAAAEGLVTVAVPARGDVRDVLITTRAGSSLRSLRGGARVGVEGARRRAFLAAHRRDLVGVPITSAELADEIAAGRLHAAIVGVDAARALETARALDTAHTLDTAELGMEILDPRAWLPEPGQGIVALVSRSAHAGASTLDHAPTRTALRAESALLDALEVSNGRPVGAVAQVSGRSTRLWAAVASPDGRHLVRADGTGTVDEPEALGRSVARVLLDRGAADLLGMPGR